MSKASSITVACNTLLGHKARRQRGLPTVSVLVSEGAPAYEIWTSYGFGPPRGNTSWSTRHPFSLARAFTEESVRSAGVYEPALHYLSCLSNRSPQEIAATIAAATPYSLRAYVESLGVEPPFLRVLLFCLNTSTRDLSLTDRAHALHAVLGGDSPRTPDRIAETSRIWGVSNLPAIWIAADGSSPSAFDDLASRVAPLASSIAERIPELPIAVSIQPSLWETYLAHASSSRAKTILRDGEIWFASLPHPIERCRQSAPGSLPAIKPEPPLSALPAFIEGPSTSGDGSALHDGARSEAERFLFARLQGNAATAGLFELNGKLEDLNERCREVDFVCRSYRVAIELDGYCHFRDLDAYRRDRAKDLELQRLGYLVIRVLAEDVVARLESVLHTISETLSTRRAHIEQFTQEPNGTTFS